MEWCVFTRSVGGFVTPVLSLLRWPHCFACEELRVEEDGSTTSIPLCHNWIKVYTVCDCVFPNTCYKDDCLARPYNDVSNPFSCRLRTPLPCATGPGMLGTRPMMMTLTSTNKVSSLFPPPNDRWGFFSLVLSFLPSLWSTLVVWYPTSPWRPKLLE